MENKWHVGVRTLWEYPIMKSIPLQEHYCPLCELTLNPKKDSASLQRGKPKGNKNNLITNLIKKNPIKAYRDSR